MRIKGPPVNSLLVEDGLDIAKEYYLAITIDQLHGCPLAMASAAVGMDFEGIAKGSPQQIIKEEVIPALVAFVR